MTYNCIYRNGKIERFFIKLDHDNEFEFIRPYYLVTSFDHPRKGRIYEMECLFSGLVWQGRQGHGYGYSGSNDVYGTLIDIIRKEYGKELSASAIAELQAVNTHENDLHLSDEMLNELEVCNDRKQDLRFTI